MYAPAFYRALALPAESAVHVLRHHEHIYIERTAAHTNAPGSIQYTDDLRIAMTFLLLLLPPSLRFLILSGCDRQ